MKKTHRLAALIILMLCVALPSLGEQVTLPVVTPAPTYSPEQWLQLWYQIGDMLRAEGNYPFVELRKGDVGSEVRALQTRLADLGYYTKRVVDEFGAGTYTAMRLFERANGLSVNGIASVRDQKLLYSHLALPSDGATADEPETTHTSATATATPDDTVFPHITPGLHTLDPDLFDVDTPTPTLYINIPDIRVPDFHLPSF